ncbi:MAG TPA: PSD1 and planctomycete cytochrome C domain-containing protein, partial [Pirellulales bacterium]
MRARCENIPLMALVAASITAGGLCRFAQAESPAEAPAVAVSPLPASIAFNRDIRPILSENCFACHGPDKNKRDSDLRLDNQEGALADLGGRHAVVPKNADQSELWKRVTTADADLQMPPAATGKTLTDRQKELLRRWIDEGAQWQPHWSFTRIERPALPPVHPAPSTATTTAGATPAQLAPIDQFIRAKLVEHDLAPAAPADKTTLVRRLYFDLTGLPPTPEQVAAFANDSDSAAYERLVDALLASPHYGERMALYWLDLVRYADTTGIHGDNHRDVTPYRDYVIRAFNENRPFDRFAIEQLAGDLLKDASQEQQVASGYNRMNMTTTEGGAQAKEYIAKYAADRVRNASTVWLGATLGCAECHDHKFDPFTTKDFYRFAAFFADVNEQAVALPGPAFPVPTAPQAVEFRRLSEQVAAIKRVLDTPAPEIVAAERVWEPAARARAAAPKTDGDKKQKPEFPEAIANLLLAPPEQLNDAQRTELAAYYRSIAPLLDPVRKNLAEIEQQLKQVDSQIPKTLVAMSVEPRVTRVLPRGNWLDESGEVVTPGAPGFLKQLDGDPGGADRRATRLDLANWVTSRDNPLVARVFVNRLWRLAFGRGLATPLDDLGAQGVPPTHLDLLDWLAADFIESGWNVKRLWKQIVMTETYRQSSNEDATLRQRDPYNLWLARQGRFRLDAEMVRDNALAISGLLSPRVGGPSAKPYQPAGYWRHLNFPVREYEADHGENLYRRGLYTYWCRTFLHPSLLAFDAPSREECTAERARSNTPLQALALLNDVTYVEAARVFAEHVMRSAGKTFDERLDWA